MKNNILREMSVQGPSTGYDYGPQGPAGNNGSWNERDADGQAREYSQPQRNLHSLGAMSPREMSQMESHMGPMPRADQKPLAQQFEDHIPPVSYRYNDPRQAWKVEYPLPEVMLVVPG